jgi:hypothetical protein
LESQASVRSTTRLRGLLTVQRNTLSRSKTDLNIDTDPSFAAPSVESGPLQLTVCVERCP